MKREHDKELDELRGVAAFAVHAAIHALVVELQKRDGFKAYRFRIDRPEPMFEPILDEILDGEEIHFVVSGVMKSVGYRAHLEADVVVVYHEGANNEYRNLVTISLFERNAGGSVRCKFHVPNVGEEACVRTVDIGDLEEIPLSDVADVRQMFRLDNVIEHMLPDEALDTANIT